MEKHRYLEQQRLMTLSGVMSLHPCVLFFFLIFIITFSLPWTPSLGDPRISQPGIYCSKSRPPPNTTIIPSFVKEMEALSQKVTVHHWGTSFVNATVPIYGLAQCYGDLSHIDCLLCFAACRTRLPRCLPSISAHIYLDGCFLRYDNYNFYSEFIDPLRDTVNCSTNNGAIVDEREKLDFSKSIELVIGNVTKTAVAKGKGFGVAEVKGVFALGQCWNTINSDDCRKCLEKAGSEIGRCAPNRDGRALYSGCYLRYSTQNFYNKDGSEIEGPSPNKGAIIAIILSAVAVLMLCIVATYAAFVRFSKSKQDHKNLRLVSFSNTRSGLNFKYETLEKATDYFNPKRKIGQGGAGSVFTGTLPNGQVVAVKRLIFNTRQWVDDFFNEINLISGIQHKNLVQLLGCSIEGPESLLVFEYIPNRSLDPFLFDKNRTQILNWKQRHNIIVGTAEGLAYLHGGTKIRIIHRDIKSSNVLLDENLDPKIADFGLARCFAADMTHLSTGIAGTLGYMAPEYLLRGQLTEKADVYSFGVLVLEIVSGRRTTVFTEEGRSLLQTVWKLHNINKLEQAVDPSLRDDFPSAEVRNVLQIGLLCTQASAALRPSMDEVVRMLSNRSLDIPLPTQPPFLNARRNDCDSSIRSYSAHSLLTNALKMIESPITTTESSSMQSSEGPSRSEDSLKK